MDRRAFLRSMLSGTVGMTLDVDKLLWVPGAKTIFIPPEVVEFGILESTAFGHAFFDEFFRDTPFMKHLREIANNNNDYDGGDTISFPFNYPGGL